MEKDKFNMVKISAGINSFDFAWNLKQNETFITLNGFLDLLTKGLERLAEIFITISAMMYYLK